MHRLPLGSSPTTGQPFRLHLLEWIMRGERLWQLGGVKRADFQLLSHGKPTWQQTSALPKWYWADTEPWPPRGRGAIKDIFPEAAAVSGNKQNQVWDLNYASSHYPPPPTPTKKLSYIGCMLPFVLHRHVTFCSNKVGNDGQNEMNREWNPQCD